MIDVGGSVYGYYVWWVVSIECAERNESLYMEIDMY